MDLYREKQKNKIINVKTPQEILHENFQKFHAETKAGEFYPTLPDDWVYDAMTEYATQQTEEKDREIEEMKVLLRKAMTEMYYSNPNETEIKTLIINYLNKVA